MSLSLISSVLWVPRGVSAPHPTKYDLSDPAELERVQRLGKIKLDDARRELEELEAGVDGMQVDESHGDGDGDGDEWESDSQSGNGSGSEGSNADVNADEATKKARKMARTIKGQAGKGGDSEEDEMKKYNLDNYDNELNKSSNLGIFSNIKGLSYYAPGGPSGASGGGGEESDPYITLQNPGDEDATLERAELEILPTDNLLISAKTTEEVSLLEVHVYEGPEDEEEDVEGENVDTDGNLYVHHDTLLPAMPLCMEWGDCRPSTSATPANATTDGESSNKGSFVAVGTLDKTIEIWDLDVVEGMFPEAILGDLSEEELKEEEEKLRQQQDSESNGNTIDGGMAIDDSSNPGVEANGEKKKKKKKKKKNLQQSGITAEDAPAPSTILPYAHTDSILSLSWNRSHRSLLASSSADSSIKLWDLSSPSHNRAIRSFSLFGGDKKVQSVQWNPIEPSVLLAGAWGGGLRVFDTRTPEAALKAQLPVQKGARGLKKSNPDVEVAHWDHFEPTNYYVASGNGQVLYYDSRMLSSSSQGTAVEGAQPVWTLDAHDGPCSALDVNEFVKGCIVTGGVDKQTKIWNVQPEDGKGISLVTSRDFGVGKVFSTLFSPDDPTTLALAGSAARLQVWDAFSNAGFRRVFGDRLRETSTAGGRVYREGGRRARGNGLVGVGEDGKGEESDDD